jgi:uncharacterized membrane-anchored protein YhcB (DUF1043 family)
MSKFHVGVVCGIIIGMLIQWFGYSLAELWKELSKNKKAKKNSLAYRRALKEKYDL